MNKRIFSLGLLLTSSLAMAQVGIGTRDPDNSALLDIQASKDDLKGVLIPRVPLLSGTDNSNINSGKIANSLLVFNTTDNAELKPGFYYWFDTEWIRILNNQDGSNLDFPLNEELAVDVAQKKLFLRDSEQNIVSVPLADINILTTLSDKGMGVYEYVSEDGTVTKIDVSSDVISTIKIILNDETVIKEIHNSIVANAKDLTSTDGSLTIVGGQKTTLNNTSIDIANEGVTTAKVAPQAITPEKIKAGAAQTILTTSKASTVEWAKVDDPIIRELVRQNESLTVLKVHDNGTFTYYNESEVDQHGTVLPAVPGVMFNANTLSIDTSQPGIYVFADKFSSTPLATINTKANAIIFEDNSTIQYNNVEEAITNITNQLDELAKNKGKLDGDGILINDTATVNDAVLKDVKLSIANNAITTAKIADKAVTTSKIASVTNGVVEDANSVLLSDGQGGVYYESVHSAIDQKSHPLEASGPIEVSNGKGLNAVLNPVTLTIADGGITERYVADKAITQDKLGAPSTAVLGYVPAVQLDNSVKYESVSTLVRRNAGALTSTDNSIAVNSGFEVKNSVLQNINLSLNDASVSTNKLQNHAVTEDKLWAGEDKESFVPVAQADGSVQYRPIFELVDGEPLTVDNSLEITGAKDSSSALLSALGLRIKEKGVVTSHIENRAVTPDKIGSPNSGKNTVLTADGAGNAQFNTVSNVLTPSMLGDVVGEGAVLVTGGENTILGDQNKKVAIDVKAAGISTKHLVDGSVTNNKIASKTILVSKLNALPGTPNRVATADELGNVSYKLLDASIITNKGNLTTDGIVTVDNGDNTVFADVELGIANKSIPASKLVADSKDAGKVATVNTDGTVAYKAIGASEVTGAAALKTDGIITVNGTNEEAAMLFNEATLSIADESITTDKIADKAITTEKIDDLSVTASKISSLGAGGSKRTLLSGAGNTVQWVELDQIIINTSGELKGDGAIIGVSSGVGATLKDVTLNINNKSITMGKLSSKDDLNPGANILKDRVMLTDGNGGFHYVTLDAVQVDGENLTLGGSLAFTSGTGIKSVLAETGIDVKDGGIETAKLADNAVTTTKISSVGAPVNTVLTADGQGKVAYQKIKDGAFESASSSLLSDGSIAVPANNNALLNEISIAIASEGVQNKHLAPLSVTADRMSSSSAVVNSILSADGNGNARYASLSSLANTEGKAMTATDGSLTLGGGSSRALLKEMDIRVSDHGIVNKHIGTKEVTTDKISSDNLRAGLVLLSDGTGGAGFESFSSVLEGNEYIGKALLGQEGINVDGGLHALLRDVTISISDNGITNAKLADKTITADKFDAESSPQGAILTSLGDGEAAYTSLDLLGKPLTSDSSIKVTTGNMALISPAAIEVNKEGILTKHIGVKQVTVSKLSSALNGNNVTANKVLMADGSGGMIFGNVNLGTGDLKESNTISVVGGEDALLKDVTLEVQENSIGTKHMADKAITAVKLGSEVGKANYLGVTDGLGGVVYQSITSVIENNAGDLSAKGALEIESGAGSKALNHNVGIRVKNKGITTDLLADAAVTTVQVAPNTITTPLVVDKNITPEKIGSLDANNGLFLVADGNGGADFKAIKAMMPKFFYLPSIYLDMSPNYVGVKDIYTEYVTQFGTPKTVNPGAGSQAKLPVLPASELNFMVTYYDEAVFENVSIGDDGVLKYSIKNNAEITGKSFMNIVLAVKDN